MPLPRKEAYKSLCAHDDTLSVVLAELHRAKVLGDADIKTIVGELAINNIGNLPPELLKNSEARKRVNNTLVREAKVVAVHPRRRTDRPVGLCYKNAYEEFVETGNPIAYGWIDGRTYLQDYMVPYIPHAFNYDKATGQYYDTTNSMPRPGQSATIAFLVTDRLQEVANKDVTTHRAGTALDKTLGGWVFLSHKDKTYVMRGWNHSDFDAEFRPCYTTLEFVEAV
jgi:hypothetical protein